MARSALWRILKAGLRIPFAIIYGIVLFTVYAVLALLVVLITSPYTLFYFSANWSMRKTRMPPVQLYLDYFQYLYPDLTVEVGDSAACFRQQDGMTLSRHRDEYSSFILYAQFNAFVLPVRPPATTLTNAVAAAHAARKNATYPPAALSFWPHKTETETVCIPFLFSATSTEHTFSQAAGLFAQLETAGWPRSLLWTFLRDKVEQNGLVGEAEKAAFSAVMEMMISRNFRGDGWWRKASHKCNEFFTSWTFGELKSWDHNVPMGVPRVEVRTDTLEWLLQGGAFLVPVDHDASFKMTSLSTLGMWKVVKKDKDLEEGLGRHWQIMGLGTT